MSLAGAESTVPVPDDLFSWDAERQADWVAAHSLYVYVDPGCTLDQITSPGTTVLAHEDPEKVAGPVLYAVFADGHVTRLDYGINLVAFNAMGHRSDGLAITIE